LWFYYSKIRQSFIAEILAYIFAYFDVQQEDKAIKELVDTFGIKKWTIVA